MIFEIPEHPLDSGLVVDPVMTWASYFAGPGSDLVSDIRELADGSLLLMGATEGLDLEPAGVLNGVRLDPPDVRLGATCFVARISPTSRQVQFISYFGLQNPFYCSWMDVDSSGRILLAGVGNSREMTTSDAQYGSPQYLEDAYLARISKDGKELQYSTFLNLDCSQSNATLFMRAGPGDTVYIATSCPDTYSPQDQTFLFRYNIAKRAFDQRTTIGPGLRILGLDVWPSGAVSVFGNTKSRSFPAQNAFQGIPDPGTIAGIVLAFSADFQQTLLSSYVGGYGGWSQLASVFPNPDGTLWLSGRADVGSIPGVEPRHPTDAGYNSLFAILATPGSSGYRKAFYVGLSDWGGPGSGLVLADGNFCLLFDGLRSLATPGGASLGLPTSEQLLLGCLKDDASDVQLVTPVVDGHESTSAVVPSRLGGVWAFSAMRPGGYSDVIPYELKAQAIQPFRPAGNSDDVVIRYIDLGTPKPAITHPQELVLHALRANYVDTVTLSGHNFSLGMNLSVNGKQIPLATNSAFSATLSYRSSTTQIPGTVIDLPAGNYVGALTVPAQPNPAISDPFPVVVRNLPPAPLPFTPTLNPLVLSIEEPVYPNSQVTWKGRTLPLSSTLTGFQVEIPADLAQGRDYLVLTNPRPGGGVQRQLLSMPVAGPAVKPADAPVVRIPAWGAQVDRKAKHLFTITDATTGHWSVNSWTLPQATMLNSATVAKGDASVVVDFKLSSDGSYLYLTDDQLWITRFRTSDFVSDLHFRIHRDAPLRVPGYPENRHRLLPLDGSPESLAVLTPAGRMMIYDRDRIRPYTTTDFPSSSLAVFDPILATTDYVYAVQRPYEFIPVPCVIRYPVDAFGFGQPEDFCNPGIVWGKYPEMKVYGGSLVLQDDQHLVAILSQLANGTLRWAADFDPSLNVASRPYLLGFDPNSRTATYYLMFSRMDTGEPTGHYPKTVPLSGLPQGMVILDDQTMVFYEQYIAGYNGGTAVIVPQWQTAVEWYP
ncbi:MAG: hypothetical protein ABI693_11935 [Bryobacteraceae bacterium]